MTELKACPFCGSTSVAQGEMERGRLCVVCIDCGARGTEVPFPTPATQDQLIAAINEAHSKWNTRTGLSREKVLEYIRENEGYICPGGNIIDADNLEKAIESGDLND